MSTASRADALVQNLEAEFADLRRHNLEPLEARILQIRERSKEVLGREAVEFQQQIARIEARAAEAAEREIVAFQQRIAGIETLFAECRRQLRELEEKSTVHACAVGRQIDHGALTRETIARFPKILEALAK